MQKRSIFAALSLAAAAAFGIPAAGAQTAAGHAGKDAPAVGKTPNGVDTTSSSAGYPGSSTRAGAQNQPRNGGATGSAGKAPNDGHAPVNPTSRANRNGAATGS